MVVNTHSPGPWEAHGAGGPKNERYIISSDGYLITLAFEDPSAIDANVNLIVAAPDLLAACKAAALVLHNLGFGDELSRAAAVAITRAIQKAQREAL